MSNVTKLANAETPTSPIDKSDVVHARFDRLERLMAANHDLVIGEVRSLSARVATVEERTNRHSDQVGKESKTNMAQDAALAELHTKVDKLTSIAEHLTAIAGNPMVRRVAYAVGGAILAYLAAKGH